jgi:hypothetical protein
MDVTINDRSLVSMCLSLDRLNAHGSHTRADRRSTCSGIARHRHTLQDDNELAG